MRAKWFGWLNLSNGRAQRELAHADAARDIKDWGTAVQHYAAYVALKPKDWRVRVQLGHALKEAGNLSAAEMAYRAAAAAAPEDADVLLHLGYLLKTMNRESDAEAVFRLCTEVLDRYPDVPRSDEMRRAVDDAARRSSRMLGDQARDARDWGEAARHYRAHLQAEGADVAIWIQLGNVSKELQQFGPAEVAYRRAMELNPMDSEASLQLGHLLKLLCRFNEAQGAFRHSAEIGGSAEAIRELSALDAGGGEAAYGMRAHGVQMNYGTRQYAPDAARVSERPPEVLNGNALRKLLNAQAARDQRSWDVACVLYGAYLAELPSDSDVWLEYAMVLRESGRFQKAYDAAVRAGTNGLDSQTLMLEKVRLLRHLGRHGQAELLSRELALKHGGADAHSQH